MSEDSTKVSQEMLRAMCKESLSGREIVVLLALTHHGVGEDNVVGIADGGTAMSATDIATYVHDDLSASNVRHVLASLVSKGILVRVRHDRAFGRSVTVHALSDRFAGEAGLGTGAEA